MNRWIIVKLDGSIILPNRLKAKVKSPETMMLKELRQFAPVFFEGVDKEPLPKLPKGSK